MKSIAYLFGKNSFKEDFTKEEKEVISSYIRFQIDILKSLIQNPDSRESRLSAIEFARTSKIILSSAKTKQTRDRLDAISFWESKLLELDLELE